MKQKISYTLVTLCSAFLFSAAMAQSLQNRWGDLVPGQLYIQKYLGNIHPDQPTKLFEYRILPLDNMVCAVPMISKPGINVVDPTKTATYPPVMVPNTLSKLMVVK